MRVGQNKWPWIVTILVSAASVFAVPALMRHFRGPRPDPYLEAADSDNDALEELAAAKTDRDRYYALGDAARVALKRKQPVRARKLANELLALKDGLSPRCWNYGSVRWVAGRPSPSPLREPC